MITPVIAAPRFDTNVEAVRVVGSMPEFVDWVMTRGGSANYKPRKEEVRDEAGVIFEYREEHIRLLTTDGVYIVSFGDWIVRNSDGHFSSYTPTQFYQRYEVTQ